MGNESFHNTGLSRGSFREQARRTLSHLSKTGDLPTLPAAAAAALALARKPDADIDELCCIIEGDLGLAARVVRIANSVVLGRRVPTKTLRDALVALGLRATCDVLVGACAKEVYKTGGPRLNELWNHALMVALSAQELARASSITDPTMAFLPGLFHDVGTIVLLVADPTGFEIIEDLVTSGRGEKIALEREWFGFDHAVAGGILTQDWGLAPEQCDAISQHHEPASDGESIGLAVVVAAADSMACALGFAATSEGPAVAEASHLGLSPEEEAVCAQQVRNSFRQHKRLLS